MTLSTGNNGNNNNSGITFFGLLAVAFIVLKLTGTIQWSWWAVLAPLWVPAVVIVVIAVVIVLIRNR